MINFPKNTEWRLSAKGNYWRKLNGNTLVVHGDAENGYWVRVNDLYLNDRIDNLEEAKSIAESEV